MHGHHHPLAGQGQLSDAIKTLAIVVTKCAAK